MRTALLTGSASGKAAFDTASGNQVIRFGPFSTGAGDLTLIDSESLTIAGAVNVVGGSGAITALNGADPFGIATPGDLTINAGAPLTASKNVVLRADHTISNNDTVTARNGAVTFTAGSRRYQQLKCRRRRRQRPVLRGWQYQQQRRGRSR